MDIPHKEQFVKFLKVERERVRRRYTYVINEKQQNYELITDLVGQFNILSDWIEYVRPSTTRKPRRLSV